MVEPNLGASEPDMLKRTPLYDEHVSAGARMIPFAGFEMPVQYTGIVGEHRAVREAAGLFDVSHMGELVIRGRDPLALVQTVTTNDASKLEVGQAQYTVLCQEDGGAIDDCIVFRFSDHYLIVTNASNRNRDREWVRTFADPHDCEVVDRSDETALLALQGPAAQDMLSRHTDADLDSIAYYHFAEAQIDGSLAVISRTGYTGEDGFELYVDASDAARIWRSLVDAHADAGLLPAGLGARDSLRLEVGYILYGNDLDDRRTPYEAGLGWVVKPDKGDFIGRDALLRQKEAGIRERLIGFVLQERGFPRQGYELRHRGEPVGAVTSGVLSPTLEQGIGLGYLPSELARPGTSIEVIVRDRAVPAEVVRPPFYRDGSIRRTQG